jgi:hypothetical protein
MRCSTIHSPTGSPENAAVPSIDDVIIEAMGDGCDKVLNLAAGLDTRPYRLDLPPDFTWVEADLPQLLAEKEQALADHFEDLGWRAVEVESVFTAAHRFDRLPRWMRFLAWLPQLDPRNPGDKTWIGVVRLSQA